MQSAESTCIFPLLFNSIQFIQLYLFVVVVIDNGFGLFTPAFVPSLLKDCRGFSSAWRHASLRTLSTLDQAKWISIREAMTHCRCLLNTVWPLFPPVQKRTTKSKVVWNVSKEGWACSFQGCHWCGCRLTNNQLQICKKTNQLDLIWPVS